jgi:Rps23 Pro-64 3,4-dihydroxylase Tpa1-like proline 4-hydroxylase
MPETPFAAVGGSLIAYDRLESQIDSLHKEFIGAAPWPHVIIDNFLEPETAKRISAAFPPIGKMKARLARLLEARSYDARIEDEDRSIVDVFEALHSERFTKFVEIVTGVSDLDPDRALVGAGLHQGARGSYLRVHADHNTHPSDPSRFRRINVMVYLNEHWQANWNGDLELWDRGAVACRTRIEPIFNRCAILSVDDTAFHGYGPLRVPQHVTRKALAAYYYSNSAAEGQTLDAHPTTMPILKAENPVSNLAHRARRAILYRVQKVIPGTSPGTRRDEM